MGARTKKKRSIDKPFPGLRPFARDENLIFFGREGQTDELVSRLKQNHFLAVLGASGSGKSSMVRAGLLPALEGGLMAGVRSKWKIAVFRPGDRPVAAMAESLSTLVARPDDPSYEIFSANEMIQTMLEASSFGIKEAAMGPILNEDENLLLVVDQFEEIFRFNEDEAARDRADDAKAFVKLLLEASNDPALPVYVVITMRSDFLGECPRFRNLPEAINEGQYLVPRLPRSQMRQAITGPAAVFGEAFSPSLVIRLLNDIGEEQDQLPILQHALMRTWDHHEMGKELTVEDYDSIGGLENALNQHAEEIYAELEAKGLGEATKQLFSCLTQIESDGKGIRRPARLSEVCAITELEMDGVIEIVDAFRGVGRSFLMPPVGVKLEPDTILDISHESFMRLWTRLDEWVHTEARSAEEYNRLSRAAREHKLGKVNLWRMPELGIALKWQKSNQPTAAWASRYDDNYEGAMAFLAASNVAWKEEEEDKAAVLLLQRQSEERKHTLKRRNAFIAVLIFLLLAAVAAVIFAFDQSAKLDKQSQTVKLQNDTLRDGKLRLDSINAVNTTLLRNNQILLNETNSLNRALQDSVEVIKLKAHELDIKERDAISQRDSLQKVKNRVATANKNLKAERDRADANAQQSREATHEAVVARRESEKQNALFRALQLAERSMETPNDDTAAVRALEAYQLFLDNDGDPYDPKIYAALELALESYQSNVRKYLHFSPYAMTYDVKNDKASMVSMRGELVRFFTDDNGPQIEVKSSMGSHGNRFVTESPDGKWFLMSGENQRTLQVYDNRNCNLLYTLNGSDGDILSAQAIPSKKIAVAGTITGRVLMWDLNQPNEPPLLLSEGDEEPFTCIALNPKGEMLAYANDLSVVGISGQGLSDTVIFQLSRGAVSSMVFDEKNTKLYVGFKGGEVGIIDIKSNRWIWREEVHKSKVTCMALSPDGQFLATGSLDNTLRLYRLDEFDEPPIIFRGHNGWVTGLAFSKDSKRIYSVAIDQTMREWYTDPETLAEDLGKRLNGKRDIMQQLR